MRSIVDADGVTGWRCHGFHLALAASWTIGKTAGASDARYTGCEVKQTREAVVQYVRVPVVRGVARSDADPAVPRSPRAPDSGRSPLMPPAMPVVRSAVP